MHFLKILCCCLAFLAGWTAPLQAEDTLNVAAGAGYKRLVEQACAAFTAQTGIRVQQVFGNMGQIVPQVKEGGDFDFVLGDKTHLESTDLVFSEEHVLGRGRLVAVVAKGVAITGLDQLTAPAAGRIAIADAKKAIYGHAAREYLANTGLWDRLQPKLLVVGTVPQVSAYVISGEVDVGFINQTEAMAIEQKVGRVLPVDETLYSPVLIVAKRLQHSPHTGAADAFLAFLRTDAARTLVKQHGL
ncbi:molybdate ABC transporter substrate-binding protein [Desulfobulbus elongatus]|uniref:molybdate ABC transporter substrate-binding protein n=1 Tax=Desulfobulbus elongatus TaxID=53332 RepID=UPI0004866988|nr:molybdate ABC transporter substrate-binding protein [Desulfobulbus elongatus]